VDRSGVITTFAGTNFNDSFGDNGPANMAAINEPIGCAFEATGVMYVAENTAHRIRRIDTNGIITTVAGNGTPGLSGDGSPAASAVIRYPRSVAVDYQGNVYFSQPNDHRIRRIDPNGIITNFAGTTQGFGGDNGPATLAQLNFPGKLAVDQEGNVYVNDTGNRRIRRSAETESFAPSPARALRVFQAMAGRRLLLLSAEMSAWRSTRREPCISPMPQTTESAASLRVPRDLHRSSRQPPS
jgi:hypothetical protein